MAVYRNRAKSAISKYGFNDPDEDYVTLRKEEDEEEEADEEEKKDAGSASAEPKKKDEEEKKDSGTSTWAKTAIALAGGLAAYRGAKDRERRPRPGVRMAK